MSGIGATLNTAKLALNAQQAGINTTGHNIANVNNPSFSRQDVSFAASTPEKFGGLSFGTGVQIDTVRRIADQLLENRLATEKSNLMAFEETEKYMNVMENIFTESADSSLAVFQSEFWNSWQEVADDPLSITARNSLVESGNRLAERFSALDAELFALENDLDQELATAVSDINSITRQIADINANIIGRETQGQANDLRDQRTGLVAQLSEFLNISSLEEADGSLTVITAGGFPIVQKTDSNPLALTDDKVVWVGSDGIGKDITEKIEGGKIAGWLQMRDSVVPKFRADLDSLAKDMIWTVNLAASGGAGLDYFTSAAEGSYATDESGLLTSLTYGDRIDYSGDFKMWVEETVAGVASRTPVTVDMGLSTAGVDSWTGTAPRTDPAQYLFTVEEGGRILDDMSITETSGAGVGTVQTGSDFASALSGGIASQTISVVGGESVLQTVDVSDAAGGADRSAKSIAEELGMLDGVTAFASSVAVDIGGITRAALTGSEGDAVNFTFRSGAASEQISFLVGATDADTQANFQGALAAAVDSINDANGDADLVLTGTGATLSIESAGGETLGMENFAYTDNATAAIGNFGGAVAGDLISFELADDDAGLNGITVNFMKGANATEDAQNLFAALTGGDTAAALTTAGYSFRLDTAGDQVVVSRDGAGFAMDNLRDSNAAVNVTADLVIQEAGTTTLDGAALTVSMTEGGAVDDALAAAVAVPGNRSVTFGALDVTEGTGTDSAAITGTVTIELEDGLNITGSVAGSGNAGTFGGDYTANGWDNAEAINFDLAFGNSNVNIAFVTNAAATNTNIADDIALQLAAAPGVIAGAGTWTFNDPAGSLTITRSGDDFDFTTTDGMGLSVNNFTDAGGDASLALTASAGSSISTTGAAGTVNLASGGAAIAVDADGGLFDAPAWQDAPVGKSLITLGGDGGFGGFATGDGISFEVDGVRATYFVTAGDTTDDDFARGIETALSGAGLDPALYSVFRNGSSVSILKTDGSAIDITGFRDGNFSGGTLATLAVGTGTGTGTQPTKIDRLEANSAFNDSVSSSRFESEGIISWERFDANGKTTGAKGLIDVSATDGPYAVEGTLAFALETGTLVAGNTFTLNTDAAGAPNPFTFSVKGEAASVLDTYHFTVTEGGQVGTDTVTIAWENEISGGTLTLEAPDTPPVLPVYVEVDGMRLTLDGGTLREGDVFTVATDGEGLPGTDAGGGLRTGETLADWHWTMDSFAGQFNKQAPGIFADVSQDGKLSFDRNPSGHRLENFRWSDTGGLSAANGTVTVVDNAALTNANADLQLSREANGTWLVRNNGGYVVPTPSIIPEGGDDSGFGVDLSGDGLADFTVDFNTPVTGAGTVTFDIRDMDAADLGFAFAVAEDGDSGLAAALGINTIYTGESAGNIEVNDLLSDPEMLQVGSLDDEGILREGDNSAALKIANLAFEAQEIKEWQFSRDGSITSTAVSVTHEGYYGDTAGEIGVISRSVQRSSDFAELLVTKINEQRDSVSAVSLDEEMINLIKFQQAYSAAAKLLTTADEMLSTLINIR